MGPWDLAGFVNQSQETKQLVFVCMCYSFTTGVLRDSVELHVSCLFCQGASQYLASIGLHFAGGRGRKVGGGVGENEA